MEPFGTRLKRLRDARGWSQEQLGFELEVSKATISKWETGFTLPRWENLSLLRRLVTREGLTLDWLIDGGDPGADGTTGTASGAGAGTASSHDEVALLVRFRELKPAQRKALLVLIAG